MPLLFLLHTSEFFSFLENKLIGFADDFTLIAVMPSQGVRVTVVVVVVVVVGQTFRLTSSNQLLGQTFWPISSNQLLANYFFIHSTTFRERGKTGEDGVEA